MSTSESRSKLYKGANTFEERSDSFQNSTRELVLLKIMRFTTPQESQYFEKRRITFQSSTREPVFEKRRIRLQNSTKGDSKNNKYQAPKLDRVLVLRE